MDNCYLQYKNIIIKIQGNHLGVSHIYFVKELKHNNIPKKLQEAHSQLLEYFRGKRKHFNIPLNIQGTNFQKQVWKALQSIPYGQTQSYQDIAKTINNPKAVRAVGNANNKNPIPIIIPCHRVIAKNGTIGGFAVEISVKETLLKLEQQN
jgi:methylated-DNA-[protein]-cysteine S-methyltransferase